MVLKKNFLNKCRCPNNKLFITALISLIFFLLVELTIRTYNLYRAVPIVDLPSHLFAGIALGTGIFWILSLTLIESKQSAAILLTFIAAVFWEILETLEDLLVENPPYLKDVFFWDGFWDIIITVIGGIVGLIIVKRINSRKNRINSGRYKQTNT